MGRRYEILEHTADVGLRAHGSTAEEAFEGVAEGVAELQGAWLPGEGEERPVEIQGRDRAALLAAWVDELLYLQDAEDLVFGGFRVDRAGDPALRATVRVAPRGDRAVEGVGVKAATYHRLRVEREPDGRWVAEIYLDV